MSNLSWKPISTAPHDETQVIVGFDCASVWIVRNAWYRSAELIKELKEIGLDFDDDDVGWWSYRHSVTQEKIEPTHWLCVMPQLDETIAADAQQGEDGK